MNTRELGDKMLLQEKRISDLELAYKDLERDTREFEKRRIQEQAWQSTFIANLQKDNRKIRKELQLLTDKLNTLAPDRCDRCGQVLK